MFTGTGTPPAGDHEVARGVLQIAQLEDPVLLNFGVSEVNWWLQYEFAPLCSRTVLVTYDKLAQWDAMAPRKTVLERSARSSSVPATSCAASRKARSMTSQMRRT